MTDGPLDVAGEVADALNSLRGGGWSAEGTQVRGPGTMAVDVDYGTDHQVQAGMAHLDLTLLLNVDRPDSSIIDCIAGIGVDEHAAVRQAVSSWVKTTASAIFEVVEHQGALAAHFSPGSEFGFDNWHLVGGLLTVYGHDGEEQALADWFSQSVPWVTIQYEITSDLDRPLLNGIKLYVGSNAGSSFAEVRINGVVSEIASAALHALPWPRSTGLTFARTFLIALQPS